MSKRRRRDVVDKNCNSVRNYIYLITSWKAKLKRLLLSQKVVPQPRIGDSKLNKGEKPTFIYKTLFYNVKQTNHNIWFKSLLHYSTFAQVPLSTKTRNVIQTCTVFFPEIWTSKDFDTANDKYKSLGWRCYCDYIHVCQICCLVPRPLSLSLCKL